MGWAGWLRPKQNGNPIGGRALLDAAATKFAEQGYHATTIRELAAATAMTPGAIYFHVPNKQSLLLAVYEEGVQRISTISRRRSPAPRRPGLG